MNQQKVQHILSFDVVQETIDNQSPIRRQENVTDYQIKKNNII